MNEKLTEYIDIYGKEKQEEKEVKERVNKYNKLIKTIMGEQNLSAYETDTYKASYIIEKRESMDEDGLLELLKAELGDYLSELGVLKVKEYIDMDALENAIYHGNITSDVVLKMDKCKKTTRIPKLRITKLKKKEDE